MSEGTRHYAIHEQDEHTVRIVADTMRHERGKPVTIAAGSFPARDGEDIDRLLKANGWRRRGQWMPADDVLSGAVQCPVEPSGLTFTNGGAS